MLFSCTPPDLHPLACRMSDMSVQAGVDGKIGHYVTLVRFPATARARSGNKRENRSVAHRETEFRIGQRTGNEPLL